MSSPVSQGACRSCAGGWASAARTCRPRARASSATSGRPTPVTTGTWNSEQAVDRTVFGLYRSTLDEVTTTASAPAASATRSTVPALPGSRTWTARRSGGHHGSRHPSAARRGARPRPPRPARRRVREGPQDLGGGLADADSRMRQRHRGGPRCGLPPLRWPRRPGSRPQAPAGVSLVRRQRRRCGPQLAVPDQRLPQRLRPLHEEPTGLRPPGSLRELRRLLDPRSIGTGDDGAGQARVKVHIGRVPRPRPPAARCVTAPAQHQRGRRPGGSSAPFVGRPSEGSGSGR